MKAILKVAALFIAASAFSLDASAGSLLGGLVTTGSDSGNSSGLISLGTSSSTTSVGVGGSDGVSVNLPIGGKTTSSGGSSIGVPGVVDVSTSSSGSGSNVGVKLLGGSGGSLSTNPLGLLGSDGGVTVGLPNLGGITGGGGNDGGGGNGGNGGNGSVNVYIQGANGGGRTISRTTNNSFEIPSGISDRLRLLLRILAERDYLRVSDGRAVCLNAFGIAEVANWVPRGEWGALQKALGKYSDDIYLLRQLLANCRSAAQRQALNLTDLNRVIAIDIQGGRPVLYML